MITWARISRIIIRALLKTGISKHRVWNLVLLARSSFARITPPLELETTFDNDIRIITLLSDHIESQVFWQGFQEADEGAVKLLKRNLPVDGVFIDIGANIGTFTLVAARQAQQGKVHAFEPSAHHFARLARNVSLNQFDNVVLNQKGLYDELGEAVLFLPSRRGEMNNSGAASLYPVNESDGISESISLMRFDDYVTEKKIGRIDVIKIDIEGAEIKALGGARHSLLRFRPLVLMELDMDNLARAGSSAQEVLELWKSLSYQVSVIRTTGEVVPVRSTNELGPHQNVECRALTVRC